uniref:Uncharacterized protein n=1 Tax=Physcomitrium patens TaxID=3218 RepID=A0A2K1IH92_PHYPA|nr:hypothetical protein PHYPA_029237 [Physcomitrium patens]
MRKRDLGILLLSALAIFFSLQSMGFWWRRVIGSEALSLTTHTAAAH